MGYIFGRVIGLNKDYFKCNLCLRLIKDIMEVSNCEHLFCKECITEWLKENPICPIDHKRINQRYLRKPPRVVIGLLDELQVKCEFESFGCPIICRLPQLEAHQQSCEYRGDVLAQCVNGCGLKNRKHSCVELLKSVIDSQNNKISKLENKLRQWRSENEKTRKKSTQGNRAKRKKNSRRSRSRGR